MTTPDITRELTQGTRAAAVIAECRLIARMTEEPGRTTRRFLTPPVVDVHEYLTQRMEALGMTVWLDAAGNLRGLWRPLNATGRGLKRWMVGSHIDTVPDAGAFDGVLGVVLALALVAEAQVQKLPIELEVIAFSEEEGVRFGVPFLGSRAVAGRFDPALLLLRDADGVTLENAIRNFGLDPANLDAAQLHLDTAGFLEIHMEQGPVLEVEDLPLGVVTGIVGQTRCELLFTGQANHAGTTPMPLRRDAVAAAAEWISTVEELALNHGQLPGALQAHDLEDSLQDETLVATVGKVQVEPNAGNVIAGTVRLSLDVRAEKDAAREAAVTELISRAEAIAARRGLRCESWRRMDQPAIPMDEELTAKLAESIAAAGLPVKRMPSGAGHDAMIVGTRIPTAMLFLRSPGGISHHPAEDVLETDIEHALTAATNFLRRLAQG